MPLAVGFLAVMAGLSLLGLVLQFGSDGLLLWLVSALSLAVCFVLAVAAIRVGQRPVVELLEEARRPSLRDTSRTEF